MFVEYADELLCLWVHHLLRICCDFRWQEVCLRSVVDGELSSFSMDVLLIVSLSSLQSLLS